MEVCLDTYLTANAYWVDPGVNLVGGIAVEPALIR